MPYTMSIERSTDEFVPGFHLGEGLAEAKALCEERYFARLRRGYDITAIALYYGRRLVDRFDGVWRESVEIDRVLETV
jgi:hypothetical protein